MTLSESENTSETNVSSVQQGACTAMFRSNPQHTGLYKTMPVNNFTEVKWKFKTEGRIIASPSVADQVVCFGTDNGFLYAVDTNKGQEKWKFKSEGKIWSTPAIVNGIVYFESWGGRLYAMDVNNGKELWSFKTSPLGMNSPTIVDGLIYLGVHWDLCVINMVTGKEVWRFHPQRKVLDSPAVADGVVYFKLGEGVEAICAVEIKTQTEKWRLEIPDFDYSDPVVSDGVVYTGSQDGYLWAIDGSRGKVKWKFQGGGNVGNPAISDGVAYFAANAYWESDVSSLYAVKTSIIGRLTGRTKWKLKVADQIASPPSIADGLVYFATKKGKVHAVDITTGEEKWHFDTQSGINSSLVIADEVVYCGTDDGNLYAIH